MRGPLLLWYEWRERRARKRDQRKGTTIMAGTKKAMRVYDNRTAQAIVADPPNWRAHRKEASASIRAAMANRGAAGGVDFAAIADYVDTKERVMKNACGAICVTFESEGCQTTFKKVGEG